MIKVYISEHQIKTPLLEIIHAFTGESVEFTDNIREAQVISSLKGNKVYTSLKIQDREFKGKNDIVSSKIRNEKQIIGDGVKLGFYNVAKKAFKRELPWGIITGIRPKKLVMEFALAGEKEEFKNRFCVSDKKIMLSENTHKAQVKLTENITENSICVYIGIPFCPTRCQYCSFVSMAMGKQQKLVQPYVDYLIKEMKYTSELIKASGKKVEALYIGGGTPTSLDEKLFDKMIKSAGEYFEKSEFTLEAGRADTITEKKLKSAMEAGVTRICINPQTMNDEILKGIGRNHTSEGFEEAFYLARNMGFDNINADVIAGLPGEKEDMFEQSFERLLKLNPDGITVHTMCIKRAADLKNDKFKSYNAEAMVDYATTRLFGEEYYPYYLYRQKDTLNALENTGFARKGKENFYNVFMMEDLGTVLGLGAGSVSKIKTDGENKFKRVFNFKNPTEYISDFDEILKRKVDYNL